MAGVITLLDQPRTLDALGRATAAIIYFYYTGTTVIAPIYNDVGMADPAANPVEIAAGEIFPDIFLDPAISYRRRILYGDGTFYDVDPLPGGGITADGIVYTPDFTGGVEQTLDQKLSTIISVTDFIPTEEWVDLKAGVSTYDVTSAIHAARDVVKGTGGAIEFPFKGPYYVSELVFDGSDYEIRTNGCSFQQTPGLTTNGDGQLHPIITIPAGSSRIRIGDCSLSGNIATDFNEYSHGIAILSADDISLGNIYGENLRGDVIYQYGRNTSDAEMSVGVTMGVISGSNIFRCIVAQAGGQAKIEGIVQKGPVGFQDYDAEPNDDGIPGGSYQPVQAEIGFIIGSAVSAVSGDAELFNDYVRIGQMDLDGDRRVNTTPPFYSHGDSALTVSRTNDVYVGSLKLRNYPQYPVNLAGDWNTITIDSLDFADCETVGSAYKAIFVQQNFSTHGWLIINGVTGTLTGNDRRLIFNVDATPLKVNVSNADVVGGMFGTGLTGMATNLRYDCNGGTSEIFLSNALNFQFVNLVVTDSATTYGLYNSDQVTFINSDANFGAGLDYTGLSTNIAAINSSLSGSSAAGVNVLSGGAYRVNGIKVVGAQGAAVTAPTGGTTIDSEGRTAINAIIARLQAHGLIL